MSPAAASRPEEGELPHRLKTILDGLSEVIADNQPAAGRRRESSSSTSIRNPRCCSGRRAARRSAPRCRRAAGGRVHRAAGQAGRRRQRPCAQGSGAGDGAAPAESARPARYRTLRTHSPARSAMRMAGSAWDRCPRRAFACVVAGCVPDEGARLTCHDRRLPASSAQKQPPQVLVDVQGIGYELDVPMSTFYQPACHR